MVAGVEIDFDPAKDAENIRRRGIPLLFAAEVFANAAGEVEDTRRDYGEVRVKAFGRVEGVLFSCTYTVRGPVRWVITVHRVREKEMLRWLREGR